jgi:hypothetical protein
VLGPTYASRPIVRTGSSGSSVADRFEVDNRERLHGGIGARVCAGNGRSLRRSPPRGSVPVHDRQLWRIMLWLRVTHGARALLKHITEHTSPSPPFRLQDGFRAFHDSAGCSRVSAPRRLEASKTSTRPDLCSFDSRQSLALAEPHRPPVRRNPGIRSPGNLEASQGDTISMSALPGKKGLTRA